MLQCEKLGKSYAGRSIFQGVGLTLGAGVYALQGENGIGKSTLLGLLAGALTADAGNIWINGISLLKTPHWLDDTCRMHPMRARSTRL